MSSELPKYLYHYTSIDVLSLILKNETIRFRRLDLMDDPNEAMSRDLGRQGKYVMVSSWTSRSDEELLTWSLYTKNLRGIRLRLPTIPFKKAFRIDQSNFPIKIKDGQPFDSYIKANDMFNDRYSIPGINFNESITRVEYTDNDELLTPEVQVGQPDRNEGVAIILSRLGKYKRNIWKRQSEWRYMFPVFPMTREILRRNDARQIGPLMYEAMIREQDPGIEYIDIPVKSEHIKSIQITLGPKVSDSDRIIVESLTEKYAPNAEINESSLLGQIV